MSIIRCSSYLYFVAVSYVYTVWFGEEFYFGMISLYNEGEWTSLYLDTVITYCQLEKQNQYEKGWYTVHKE